MRPIRIGTRGSKLALWQANYIRDLLEKENPEFQFELVIIKTTGDKILDVALSKIGDKGLFTKDLEIALLNNEIDLAVHSMKDVPTKLADQLGIASMPARESSVDILISNKYNSFAELPAGATLGTSSLRRKAQLSYARKDLNFTDIRGNVDTRLNKLDKGEYDAIVLAYAGIHRLGWGERITEQIPFSVCLPAVGQGAIGIESRNDDDYINNLLARVNDLRTWFCVNIERTVLGILEGGCQVPVGCQAYFENEKLQVIALVADVEGTNLIKETKGYNFSFADLLLFDKNEQLAKANEFGREVAGHLVKAGALELIKKIR
jgi:hydroxymethylbilane synthase